MRVRGVDGFSHHGFALTGGLKHEPDPADAEVVLRPHPHRQLGHRRGFRVLRHIENFDFRQLVLHALDRVAPGIQHLAGRIGHADHRGMFPGNRGPAHRGRGARLVEFDFLRRLTLKIPGDAVGRDIEFEFPFDVASLDRTHVAAAVRLRRQGGVIGKLERHLRVGEFRRRTIQNGDLVRAGVPGLGVDFEIGVVAVEQRIPRAAIRQRSERGCFPLPTGRTHMQDRHGGPASDDQCETRQMTIIKPLRHPAPLNLRVSSGQSRRQHPPDSQPEIRPSHDQDQNPRQRARREPRPAPQIGPRHQILPAVFGQIFRGLLHEMFRETMFPARAELALGFERGANALTGLRMGLLPDPRGIKRSILAQRAALMPSARDQQCHHTGKQQTGADHSWQGQPRVDRDHHRQHDQRERDQPIKRRLPRAERAGSRELLDGIE